MESTQPARLHCARGDGVIEMSDVLSADTTDVVAVDTTNVLAADTADVLSADATDVMSAHTTHVVNLCQVKFTFVKSSSHLSSQVSLWKF